MKSNTLIQTKLMMMMQLKTKITVVTIPEQVITIDVVGTPIFELINAVLRRMFKNQRTVVVLSVCICVCISVCLSVTTNSATYFIHTRKARYLMVLYGVFKVLLSLKMLCSRVMVSFAGHCRFLSLCGELFMFLSTKRDDQPKGYVLL